MPTVNLKDLTEKISPHAFAKYLSSTGWTIFPTKKDYIKIFQFKSTEDDFYQIIIPMDRTLSDYKSAMYEAVETVSVVEKQSTEQLMLYLLNLSKLKETTKQTVTVAKFATVDSRTSSPYDMKRLERAIGIFRKTRKMYKGDTTVCMMMNTDDVAEILGWLEELKEYRAMGLDEFRGQGREKYVDGIGYVIET